MKLFSFVIPNHTYLLFLAKIVKSLCIALLSLYVLAFYGVVFYHYIADNFFIGRLEELGQDLAYILGHLLNPLV